MAASKTSDITRRHPLGTTDAMVANIALALALFAYLGVFAIFVYVCLIADPETSRLSRFLNETLPTRIWNWLGNRLSRKAVDALIYFSDRFLLVIYCIVVYGAWSLVFWLVFPWITRSESVSNVHKYLGSLVFVACIASWRLATTKSPGIITARTLNRYNHFPYDNILFEENRTCKTTGIQKVARSKFDRHRYHANVPRYDHFCGWVYNTIGEENYRWFLLFLLVHTAMCAYGCVVLWWLFSSEISERRLLEVTYVDRFTGEEIPASMFIVAQYLFNKFLWEAGLFMLMAVMAVALLAFLVYHIYLTTFGMTTNESYKWGYVKTWYKGELKRYEEAVKARPATQPSDGTLNSSDQQQGKTRQDVIRHPGRPPFYIYDRGFIENWKEVIFPISLRDDRSIELSTKPKAD